MSIIDISLFVTIVTQAIRRHLCFNSLFASFGLVKVWKLGLHTNASYLDNVRRCSEVTWSFQQNKWKKIAVDIYRKVHLSVRIPKNCRKFTAHTINYVTNKLCCFTQQERGNHSEHNLQSHEHFIAGPAPTWAISVFTQVKLHRAMVSSNSPACTRHSHAAKLAGKMGFCKTKTFATILDLNFSL